MEDERGFHLEIHVFGSKEIHYFDTRIDRFMDEAHRKIADFMYDYGKITDNNEKIANNIQIKIYTV